MYKHRDTGCLDNRLEYFVGEKYRFVALVNSPSKGGEAWSGVNSVGFCIMNTATYDLKDDNVPDSLMDREGILMYRALEVCQSVSDFEHLLDTLSRPMGVEANFGVIDAFGGAAYYEVNNHRWTKFDVNEIPCGYRVVTNFTQTGRPSDRKGVDRWKKASAIMNDADVSAIDHRFFFDSISRSGKPILRDITSAAVAFEGVSPGEDPLHTVMWSLVGYPASTVAFPVYVMDRDCIPPFLKSSPYSENCKSCTMALYLKGKDVSGEISSVEDYSEELYSPIIRKFKDGEISRRRFVRLYEKASVKVFSQYSSQMHKYLP